MPTRQLTTDSWTKFALILGVKKVTKGVECPLQTSGGATSQRRKVHRPHSSSAAATRGHRQEAQPGPPLHGFRLKDPAKNLKMKKTENLSFLWTENFGGGGGVLLVRFVIRGYFFSFVLRFPSLRSISVCIGWRLICLSMTNLYQSMKKWLPKAPVLFVPKL